MELNIETIEFLLLVAAIVAMLARRFRLPYSMGLVVAGIALSLLPGMPRIQFSRELIFTVLLPPLIFEAALYIHWQDLRKDLLVILAMATVGVLLSACVTTLRSDGVCINLRAISERQSSLRVVQMLDLCYQQRGYRPLWIHGFLRWPGHMDDGHFSCSVLGCFLLSIEFWV